MPCLGYEYGKEKFSSYSWCTNNLLFLSVILKPNFHLCHLLKRRDFPLESWSQSGKKKKKNLRRANFRPIKYEERCNTKQGGEKCKYVVMKAFLVNTPILSSHVWQCYLSFKNSHQNILYHESCKIRLISAR